MKPIKPRGRPRTVCDTPGSGSTLTMYVPKTYHDRIVKLAQQHEKSVSAMAFSLLKLRLPR